MPQTAASGCYKVAPRLCPGTASQAAVPTLFSVCRAQALGSEYLHSWTLRPSEVPQPKVLDPGSGATGCGCGREVGPATD